MSMPGARLNKAFLLRRVTAKNMRLTAFLKLLPILPVKLYTKWIHWASGSWGKLFPSYRHRPHKLNLLPRTHSSPIRQLMGLVLLVLPIRLHLGKPISAGNE